LSVQKQLFTLAETIQNNSMSNETFILILNISVRAVIVIGGIAAAIISEKQS